MGVEVNVFVAVGRFVAVGVAVLVGVNVAVCVRVGVAVFTGVEVAVGVEVLVGETPPVEKFQTLLEVVELPSLTAAYHSYSALPCKPDQFMDALPPLVTPVTVPSSANGSLLSML